MKLSSESVFLALGRLIARNRRRYGGYIIHMGIILMGLGVVGTTMFQQETEKSMRAGDVLTLGRYTITYQGSETYIPPSEPDKTVFKGYVAVSVDGGPPMVMTPYREVFQQGSGLLPPALWSTPAEDLYILFQGEEGGFGVVKVFINPLVGWLWAGGVVLIIGTLVAMWPSRAGSTALVRATDRLAVGRAGQ